MATNAKKKKAVKSNLTKLKNSLKTINTNMDALIKNIGTNGDGAKGNATLIGSVENLNQEFHDTAEVKKIYNNANTALNQLQNNMIDVDSEMQMLQGYYDLLVKLKKK